MKQLLKQKGFTLIELIMTISVLSVVTALVLLPKASETIETYGLVSASKQIQQDLKYAQNLATTTGKTHGFKITDTGDANEKYIYEIYEKSSSGEETTVTSPYDHQAMSTDLTEKYNNVYFEDSYVVEFDSNGVPSNLTQDETIQLTNSETEESKSIVVSKNTGQVTII